MKRILLVEDDPFIVDIYANQLKREGYEVDIAGDGVSALQKVKHHCPDLLVLDILLPKMDGWELLKQLRDEETTKHVKVIVISNLNEKDQVDNIVHFGVIKYFLKIGSTVEEITSFI